MEMFAFLILSIKIQVGLPDIISTWGGGSSLALLQILCRGSAGEGRGGGVNLT